MAMYSGGDKEVDLQRLELAREGLLQTELPCLVMTQICEFKRDTGNPILNTLSKTTTSIFLACKRPKCTCLQS